MSMLYLRYRALFLDAASYEHSNDNQIEIDGNLCLPAIQYRNDPTITTMRSVSAWAQNTVMGT